MRRQDAKGGGNDFHFLPNGNSYACYLQLCRFCSSWLHSIVILILYFYIAFYQKSWNSHLTFIWTSFLINVRMVVYMECCALNLFCNRNVCGIWLTFEGQECKDQQLHCIFWSQFWHWRVIISGQDPPHPQTMRVMRLLGIELDCEQAYLCVNHYWFYFL